MSRAAARRGPAALVAAAVLASAGGCVSTTPPLRPTEADLAGVRRLAVVVPPPGDFGVFQARAKGAPPEGAGATIGAAAAFGLVGALVAGATVSAVVKDADDRRTAQVAPHLQDFKAREVFARALAQTLRELGRFEAVEVLDAAPGGGFDAVATAAVGDWGLHLIPSREADALGGFAELGLKLTVGPGAHLAWEERRIFFGAGRHRLAAYAEDAALLRRELTEMLEAAGERVAAELLFPREGKR